MIVVGGSGFRMIATRRPFAVFPLVESAPFDVCKLKSHFQKWNQPTKKKLSFNSIAGTSNFRFSIAASFSSPSLDAGTGSDYSDKLFGPKQRHKEKKKIAGIDQDELLDPTQLADQDSCFCKFNEISVHHKVCEDESSTASQANKIGLPMILLHGFGASLFTWHKVMKSLASVTGSKVLAFDRPAFGLTSRIEPNRSMPLNPYSTLFSTLLTLNFIESFAAQKAILVGHSAGAIIAVNAYFEAPERVAALILIAPAIVAPLMAPKPQKKNSQTSSTTVSRNPFIMFFSLFSKIYKFIIYVLGNLFKFVNSIYKKALSGILLSGFGVMLVRILIDKFAIWAVRSAWYDQNKVPDYILHGYTKPLKAKGWDRALVEYTAALLVNQDERSKPSPKFKLEEITCPVLIITGDTDRLVPSWNAVRLSKFIPGSSLEIVKNCGHMPHEEKTEEFISIVENFLQRVFFSSSYDLRIHPAT